MDSCNTFTASSVGQDGSCSICTAQSSGGPGLFSALLMHSIKTSGLVTEQGGEYWQEVRPLFAPCHLLTTLHQSEKKTPKQAGCVQGRSWNSAQVNGKYPDGCGNLHDRSQIKTKWKQNHMPCILHSLALSLSPCLSPGCCPRSFY